jgi:hypothetical protein
MMKKNIIIISLILFTLLLAQCKSSADVENTYAQITGAWAQKEDENVDFIISKDSIEYFDTGFFYNYKISNKKDFIITDSNKVILKFKIIKLSKDSLIIQSKNDGNRDLIYKYYKR